MKSGKTLSELASELESMKTKSRDFIVPVDKLKMEVQEQLPPITSAESTKVTPVISFSNGDREQFPLNGWAHSQMASFSDVPKSYYDRLKDENPYLLADNVNHGLQRQISATKMPVRMVRTYNDHVRALVSDRYRRLDCYDLLETVLPVMVQNALVPVSCEITERRMYVKATTERITSEITKGDIVQYGLVISSSDVGAGSVRVEPLIYRLVCLNGMISNVAIKKFHLGRSQAEEDVYELLTDDTRNLTDAAFWSQVRDVVVSSLQPKVFEAQVEKLRLAASNQITNYDIPQVVELAAKQAGVTGKSTLDAMVAYLANGADGAGLTQWGLANAFTHAAQSDAISYDDATDLERAGSRIIELPRQAWKHIAEARA